MKGQIRVLVADDVPSVRVSLEAALTDAGFAVTLAEDGKSGLDLALSGAFDVLVTDIWMPSINGLQMLRRLRTERPTLRMFAITGGGPKMTMETASSLAEVWGAEQVFIKPFDEALLVDAIRGATRT